MIYVIVPTFARVKETKAFLISLQAAIKKDYLVLMIDDHPDKVTYKEIKENKYIKILTPQKELWWVGSINLGIKRLFDEYELENEDLVIFANNDVLIDKKSFEILINELKQNQNQIVHPRTFDQNNIEVSSGTRIVSFFPYITRHPKNFFENKIHIDMGSARFLCMTATTLKKVGFINKDLVQYLGDNDFTLRAKRKYNINTYILRDAICKLDDTQTGIKNTNIKNIKELWNSFSSIKSPNNIKYRYRFFKSHFNLWFSFFITLSMTFNTLVKFIIRKIR